jgi:pilus assembly protein CpaE
MSELVLATENAEFEARVRDAFGGDLDGPLRYWRDDLIDDPGACVRALANGGTRVVTLGPGIPEQAALTLARQFDEQRPDISVLIVAPPSTDLLRSALRAGARDVISPESPAEELHEALDRAFEAAMNRSGAFDAESDGDNRRVIVTLCPKGGVGKTTLSTNLALGLAKAAPGEVVILDLDLQFGDVASALGLLPDLSFTDATRALDVLDATTLKAHLTAHPDGLFVLCAPPTPTDSDRLTVEHVEHVVRLLSDSFRYVVIDTPSGLDENTLAALEFATDLVLLSATDIPSIRSTRKEIDALRVIGKPQQQWHVVLNRADAKTGLTIPVVEQALGVTVDVAIPSSRAVPVSLNQGEPVIASDPRAPVSLAMQQIVSRFAPVRETASAGRTANLFRRR